MPFEIDWNGNDGCINHAPGTKDAVACGVCGTPMNVKRNALGPTSFGEAMTGKKHLHDCFTCPYVKEYWHKKIYSIKGGVFLAKIKYPDNYEKLKEIARKKIIKILNTHLAR